MGLTREELHLGEGLRKGFRHGTNLPGGAYSVDVNRFTRPPPGGDSPFPSLLDLARLRGRPFGGRGRSCHVARDPRKFGSPVFLHPAPPQTSVVCGEAAPFRA